MTDLDDPPVEEELDTALGMVKLRKAGGTSRIVAEVLMFGGLLLHRVLLGLLIGERVVSLMAGEMC